MTANTSTLKRRFALFAYRLFVMPTVALSLPILAIFHEKIREGLRLRRSLPEPLHSKNQPIWIHAASGEFEYAKAVIRELKLRDPATPVVVTYFSPSFAKAVHKFEGVDMAMALPLDLPGPCHSFLKRVRPKMLLIARTDLWPEILTQAREQNIPIYLFSYTQKKIDGFWQKIFVRERLQLADRVFSVSSEDESELNKLELKIPHERLGDTRYDQVSYRLEHGQPLPLKNPANTPVFVAGSTWTEDEQVLLPGLQRLLAGRKLKLILVPHEPHERHLEEVEAELQKLNLSSRRISNLQSEWFDEHVLIIDRMGILAELYLLADYAFVGGSFKRTVHSVMEALGAGCLTFVGPKHLNNREALEFKELKFSNTPGLTVIENANELHEKLEAFLSDGPQVKEFKLSLNREFQSRLGASKRLVDQINLNF